MGTCEVAAGEALPVTQTVAEPLADVEAHDEAVTDTLPEPLGEGDSLSLCVAVTQAEDEGDEEGERLEDEVAVAYCVVGMGEAVAEPLVQKVGDAVMVPV